MNRGMNVPEELRQLSYRLVHERELLLDVTRRADSFPFEYPRSVGINDLAVRAIRAADEAARWVMELRKIYG